MRSGWFVAGRRFTRKSARSVRVSRIEAPRHGPCVYPPDQIRLQAHSLKPDCVAFELAASSILTYDRDYQSKTARSSAQSVFVALPFAAVCVRASFRMALFKL